MHLYHFTSKLHLPLIEESGHLLPSESNVDSRVDHYGPDVLWLLDTPAEPTGFMQHGLSLMKRDVRFTVETSLAVKWTDWTWTSQMEPDWRHAFVTAGGGPEAADRWWVLPGRVARARWVAIDILE